MEERKNLINPSISVVIPNYNGKYLLEQNLPYAYAALRKANVEYEIIVSDDASTDDSVSFLKKNYPEIKIVENKVNRGFSHTINSGILAAKNYLVLALNSDVQLSENYFAPQLKYFSKEDTFGVMGRIIGLNDDRIQDAGKYPARKGMKVKSVKNYIPKKSSDKVWAPSLFLSGANALMRRDRSTELGGFDEIYSPFYMEDVDLSIRAWRLGWKSYYEHESVCRHPVSATIAAFNKLTKIKTTSLRNQFIFHAIHLEDWSLKLWKLQTIIGLPFSLFPIERSNSKAFREYLKKKDEIKASKEKMEILFNRYKKRYSLYQVIEMIKKEIKFSDILT